VKNLNEEVRKGMRDKAEQGIHPSRPPLGYRNNKVERTIEVDPDRALIAQRLFDLCATGKYCLSTLRNKIRAEFGPAYPNGYLQRLLKNPFYIGSFVWEGKIYPGTHPPLVDRTIFGSVLEILQGRNRPKLGKHEFAFSGPLQCAYGNYAVTAEIKKNKYIYYLPAIAGNASFLISEKKKSEIVWEESYGIFGSPMIFSDSWKPPCCPIQVANRLFADKQLTACSRD
jgi:site-specific DNA recombinase